MAKQPHLQRTEAAGLSRPHRVAMIAFPGVELLDVVGPLEAFANADALAARGGTYSVTMVAKTVGPVSASSGLTVHAAAGLDSVAEADTVLIAGGAGVEV